MNHKPLEKNKTKQESINPHWWQMYTHTHTHGGKMVKGGFTLYQWQLIHMEGMVELEKHKFATIIVKMVSEE